MKIQSRQQLLVVLTLATAALYVAVNFIIQPLGAWWSSRQKQVHELRLKVAAGRKLVASEQTILGRWDDMQANALPSDISLAEARFLKAVDEWSQSSGVDLGSLMPQWKNDSADHKTLSCRVESSGDIGSLTRFLYDLEKGPMALRVDSVELAAKDKDGQRMTMGVEISALSLTSPSAKPK